jgi:hypothetical protein
LQLLLVRCRPISACRRCCMMNRRCEMGTMVLLLLLLMLMMLMMMMLMMMEMMIFWGRQCEETGVKAAEEARCQ